MTRRLTAIAAIVLVASTSGLAVTHAGGPVKAWLQGGHCTLDGTGRMTGPDDGCTPGVRHGPLTRAAVCKHRDRADVSDLRRGIIRDYGMDPKDFRGELDHRVPHFLGGSDTKANLWPEPGSIPNAKDRLEFYVHARVCDAGTMTPRAAVRVFRGDWRKAYRRYKP